MSATIQLGEQLGSPYAIRAAKPSDLAFVRSGWIESLMVRVRSRVDAEVKRLVRTGNVRVACDRTDEDALLGFAVLDSENPALLHYVYVRRELRREGIATVLVRPDEVREYSFATDDLERCFRPTERRWTHSPRIKL